MKKNIYRKKAEPDHVPSTFLISHNITHSKESYGQFLTKGVSIVFNLATAIISRIITRPREEIAREAGFKSQWQKGKGW